MKGDESQLEPMTVNEEQSEREMAGNEDQLPKSSKSKSIHCYALSGDLDGLQKKLKESPSLLNAQDSMMKQTPLHLAASKGNVEMIEFLINQQLSENINLEATDMFKETALHVAIKSGCTEAVRLLLDRGASLTSQDINGFTPLHLGVGYSLQVGDCSIVKTLLEHGADCNIKDLAGKTPSDHLPEGSDNVELQELFKQHLEEQRKQKLVEVITAGKATMAELSKKLSSMVGLCELKSQLDVWTKGMVLDDLRRAFGHPISDRKPPHLVFIGNPGTGKTTVARILGKLLNEMEILPSSKVIEVQRTDLVGEYIGSTGPKTRKKIWEAKGGILFVDEAYRLIPYQTSCSKDFGLEALEEIMSAMESGGISVIFAGYKKPMKRTIASNEGLCRRITKVFYFDDYNSKDLAEMTILKMGNQDENSYMRGFKLHQSCSAEAIAELIEAETTEVQRSRMNGSIVDHMLRNAKDNLNLNLNLECMNLNLDSLNENDLITIKMEDLTAGLKSISHHVSDCISE